MTYCARSPEVIKGHTFAQLHSLFPGAEPNPGMDHGPEGEGESGGDQPSGHHDRCLGEEVEGEEMCQDVSECCLKETV